MRQTGVALNRMVNNVKPKDGCAPKTPRRRTAADLVSANYVKVPLSFPAVAALRVAELKKASCLLVEDRGRLVGCVHQSSLKKAPQATTLGRLLEQSPVSVPAHMPEGVLRRFMDRQALDCVAVTSGSMFLGLVERHQLGPLRVQGIPRQRAANDTGPTHLGI